MIKQILAGQKMFEYYDANEIIRFAKGSDKAPVNFKEMKQSIKLNRNGK